MLEVQIKKQRAWKKDEEMVNGRVTTWQMQYRELGWSFLLNSLPRAFRTGWAEALLHSLKQRTPDKECVITELGGCGTLGVHKL